MKLRTTAATALAASAAVLALGAVPANAATTTLRATSLTLKASTVAAQYGQWVTLTAHLGATAHNRVVEIDLGRTPIKKAVVDRHGNLSVSVKAHYNSNFYAKFAGDSADKPAVAGVHVNTAAVVNAGMVGAAYTSGGYSYYHTSQNPTIRGTVSPNKAGQKIWIRVQSYYSGAWHNVSLQIPSFQLDGASSAGVYLQNVPAGVTLREALVYGGDSVNTASKLTWHYVKVVK